MPDIWERAAIGSPFRMGENVAVETAGRQAAVEHLVKTLPGSKGADNRGRGQVCSQAVLPMSLWEKRSVAKRLHPCGDAKTLRGPANISARARHTSEPGLQRKSGHLYISTCGHYSALDRP